MKRVSEKDEPVEWQGGTGVEERKSLDHFLRVLMANLRSKP